MLTILLYVNNIISGSFKLLPVRTSYFFLNEISPETLNISALLPKHSWYSSSQASKEEGGPKTTNLLTFFKGSWEFFKNA